MIEKIEEGIEIYQLYLHEFAKDLRIFQREYGKDSSTYPEEKFNMLNISNIKLIAMEKVLGFSRKEMLEFRKKEGICGDYIVEIISRSDPLHNLL